MKQPAEQLRELIKLQNLLSEFAEISRVVFHKSRKAENDAEHSLTLALAAWHLARENPKLDLEKVIKYALIHDLPEIFAGDTDIFDDNNLPSKHLREKEARAKLRQDYPEFVEFWDLCDEYEKRNNDESKFVYYLDKVMPIILNFTSDGYGWKKHDQKLNIEKLRAIKDEKVKHSPEIERIYLELVKILEKKPELFDDSQKCNEFKVFDMKDEMRKMSENLCKLFSESRHVSLSTICSDGSPYGTWLRFASDGEYLYFDNVPSSVHVDNIKHDPRVFITLLNLEDPDYSISGYISSYAEILSGDEAKKAFKLLQTVGHPDPKNDIYCRVKIGEIDKLKRVKNPDRQFYFISEEKK